MIKIFIQFQILFIFSLLNIQCGNQKSTTTNSNDIGIAKYLALGDSYTIGESVCKTCTYSHQLVDSVRATTLKPVDLRIIAKTGWTTSDLLKAILKENPAKDYDLVTLLIGVNNQYQHQDFSIYEKEFPELLNKAIELANGKKENVIVISIPDYAFTPFGQTKEDPESITEELKNYNGFAKSIAEEKEIPFINITDITQNGLERKDLVASDGLHPSAEAYRIFVNRIYAEAIKRLD